VSIALAILGLALWAPAFSRRVRLQTRDLFTILALIASAWVSGFAIGRGM
jgi:hypothetical protein